MNRNRKCMSFMAMVLVFTLIISCMGIGVFAQSELKTFTSEMEAEGSNEYWPYFDAWNNSPEKKYPSFAVRFKVASSFTGGMMALYVEDVSTNPAKVDVSLYQWNKDYATSTAGAVKASASFNPVPSEGRRMEAEYSFDAAQPAGEYVAVFKVTGTKPFFPLKAKGNSSYEECYMDGVKVNEDFFGGILFENYEKGGFVAVEKELQSVPFYDTGAESKPLEISESYGIQFAAGMPFDKIYISCPSWGDNVGSLRWTLYRWQTSYADTIKGKAVATADFIDLADNQVQYFTFDEDVEAGEYLLLIENITDGTNQVGIWGVAGSSEHVHMYKDGKIYTEGTAAMKIDVVGKNTDYYASLSAANEGDSGSGTGGGGSGTGGSGSGSGTGGSGSSGSGSGDHNQPQNPGSGDNTVNVVMYAVIMAAVTCAYMLKKTKRRETL